MKYNFSVNKRDKTQANISILAEEKKWLYYFLNVIIYAIFYIEKLFISLDKTVFAFKSCSEIYFVMFM